MNELIRQSQKGMKVMARQRNHDAFYRPECLSHLPLLPLYLMVAHWGWCTGNVLTSVVISTAFRLEPRRAQSVMRYFLRYETNINFVCPRRGAVRITALPPVDIGDECHAANKFVLRRSEGGAVRDRTAHKERELALQLLRRWFLQGEYQK